MGSVPAMPACLTGAPVCVPDALLPIQLPSNVSGKAADDEIVLGP